MLNIVLFGPPGSGKGTQSERIIKNYGLIHLSTGDILRNEINAGTPLGLEAKTSMDKGELVPDTVVIGMISNIISEKKDSKGFIFDGFPRTIAQAQALDAMLNGHGLEVNMMLMLDVDEDELKKRLTLRGGKSGREDDINPDVIQKRINVYHEQTEPVFRHYRKLGKSFPVNGMQTEENVFADLDYILNKFKN